MHHAEAYNARINELDHISYRDYYQKYKKRLQGLITPSPIKSISYEQKQRLRQAMQKQGIYGNQKRHQRDFQIKNKRQQQAIQANNYNKEQAVLKMKQLERIKRSPREEQFKRVLLAKQQSRDQFLNRGQNQSFSNSNMNSKPDLLQKQASKQFSLQRDQYYTNPHSPGLPSINGSEFKGASSNIFGLPQRAKDNQKDQIYNYDSVYNVFGRHYTKRYQRNSQNSQKLSIISDPAIAFQENQIASKQRLKNKTPFPGDFRKQGHSNLIGENVEPHRAVSISPTKFNREINRGQSKRQNVTLDVGSRNQVAIQQKSFDRLKSKQNNNSIAVVQNDYGQNDLPPLSQHANKKFQAEQQSRGQHQRSKTIDESIVNPNYYSNNNKNAHNNSLIVNTNSNNNFYANASGGGPTLNNQMDAKVRNYLRIQDNLRSMRTNKQLINEYSVDKRGKDDTLAHYGQFMIKNN